MALVGLLETRLTLNLTDEITQSRGCTNRECVALGAANIASVKPFLSLFDPAIDALKTLRERYARAGKHLRVLHLSERCKQLLRRAGEQHGD